MMTQYLLTLAILYFSFESIFNQYFMFLLLFVLKSNIYSSFKVKLNACICVNPTVALLDFCKTPNLVNELLINKKNAFSTKTNSL